MVADKAVVEVDASTRSIEEDGVLQRRDRKSVVQGKSVDLGGRRIIKKKKKKEKKRKEEKKKRKKRKKAFSDDDDVPTRRVFL